ncbi:MAG: DUF4401 domain-containing protein [Verrucomicrobia bacterium]|nr:DUF4401 domain-containing protein [Verrucomicrobiota bacterium]
MSAIKRGDLWLRLRDHGLVEGDMPEAGDAGAPWFVRVMLGIAGWIGAMFLLGFVGVGFSFVFKSSVATFVVGIGACIAAVAIFRAAPKNDFVGQFGLAVSLAGQVMMAFGVGQWLDDSLFGTALYIALQQTLLFILMPNFVHRLWASWTGALAAAVALMDAGLFGFTPAITTGAFACVALAEFKLARHGTLLRAGIYGLALAAVQTAVMHDHSVANLILEHNRHGLVLGATGIWLGRLASLAVFLWVVTALLKRDNLSLSSGSGRLAVIGALVLGLVSIKAPGVGPAAAILIIGYANADRVLVGLGIFALLGYLSHYYYSMQTTLLEKSGLLIAFGIVLLLARLGLRYGWQNRQTENTETNHA